MSAPAAAFELYEGAFEEFLRSLILTLSTVVTHFFTKLCKFVRNISVIVTMVWNHTVGAIFYAVFCVFEVTAAFFACEV